MALHVVFRVGEAEYVLAAHDVVQMETWRGATPVPGAPAWLAGVVQLRERVVPVVDLRARFDLPPKESDIDDRLVVVRAADTVVALKVDRAREVLEIEEEAFQRPPEAVRAGSGGFVDAVIQRDERLLMHMDFDRVVDVGSFDGQEA